MCAQHTLTIDPVTRIEGHLRIDLTMESNTVVEARSSGTSFRGFEKILVGRDPRDAVQITQRICGVCPIPHAQASCAALEDAAATAPNAQARLLRNLIQAANFLDSHLLHFYVLTLPDFVSGMPTAGNWPSDEPARAFRGGEPLNATRLAENAAASLEARRHCHALAALFGGKMPHTAGIVPGGATGNVTDVLLQDARDLATKIRDFTRDRYRADADRLCAAFSHLSGHGVGNGDFLSFGAFPDNDGELMLPRGLVTRDGEQREVDATAITESVASSRFEPSAPLHPQEGETQPLLNRQDAYTWIKAPRLDGRPCEVGPLARAVVAGTYDGPKDLLARHLARAEEALTLADKLQDWIDGLVVGETGCPALLEIPTRAEGAGLTEAPRGALGHWISIDSRTVQHYQVISPTTWNGSPRDESGAPGPMETGLVGQKVADLDDPIEALRVVHSFDPCVQCAVH